MVEIEFPDWSPYPQGRKGSCGLVEVQVSQVYPVQMGFLQMSQHDINWSLCCKIQWGQEGAADSTGACGSSSEGHDRHLFNATFFLHLLWQPRSTTSLHAKNCVCKAEATHSMYEWAQLGLCRATDPALSARLTYGSALAAQPASCWVRGAEKEKLFLADVVAQLSPSRGDTSHPLRQAWAFCTNQHLKSRSVAVAAGERGERCQVLFSSLSEEQEEARESPEAVIPQQWGHQLSIVGFMSLPPSCFSQARMN